MRLPQANIKRLSMRITNTLSRMQLDVCQEIRVTSNTPQELSAREWRDKSADKL